MTPSVVRFEKTCASQDFSTLRLFRVTNPKPKRWRTAIKARENQLLTLAKEALQEKKERRVIHFLDYIDQDIAA